MTQEEFLRKLGGAYTAHKYEIKDGELIVDTTIGIVWEELPVKGPLFNSIKFISNEHVIIQETATPYDLTFDNHGLAEINLIECKSKITFTERCTNVYLKKLEFIKEGAHLVFENVGGVSIPKLEYLTHSIEFKNQGRVELDSVVNIPDGFAFRSKTSYLDLNSYKPEMNSGVSFTSSVYFYKENTYDWKCNIEGIKPYKILTSLLKKNK